MDNNALLAESKASVDVEMQALGKPAMSSSNWIAILEQLLAQLLVGICPTPPTPSDFADPANILLRLQVRKPVRIGIESEHGVFEHGELSFYRYDGPAIVTAICNAAAKSTPEKLAAFAAIQS